MKSLEVAYMANDEFSIGVAKAKLDEAGIVSSVSGGGPYGSAQPSSLRLLVGGDDVTAAQRLLGNGGELPVQHRHGRRVRMATWCFIAAAVGIPVAIHVIRLLTQ